MKKMIFTFAAVILSIFILAACTGKETDETNETNGETSPKTAALSSTEDKTSGETATDTEEPYALPPMPIV